MHDPSLTTIVQVSTVELNGGAAWVAWRLFSEYRRRGLNSYLAVGRKLTGDPDVREISSAVPLRFWSRRLASLASAVNFRAGRPSLLGKALRHLVAPSHWIHRRLGIEDFGFPGTAHIADLFPHRPEVIHCHNLHGQFEHADGYFDLRALASLSKRFPLILTLHDAWHYTGHCAHSFECERWRTGCGRCPDLTIYPGIRRDATAWNWRRKKKIYLRSSLFLATPSQWLMEKAKHSILAPAIRDARVIPNGVDLSIFRPGDRDQARRTVGLHPDGFVLLFAAANVRDNVFKDFATLRTAFALLAERLPGIPITLVALGGEAPPERSGLADVRFFPYTPDPGIVAQYYQAANLYLHAARADTFPNTIVEALACGTPVVATAVGGIPEQIKGLRAPAILDNTHLGETFDPADATGVLVPAGGSAEIARAIQVLLDDNELREQLGRNATRDARARFDLETQVNSYISWYKQIIQERPSAGVAPGGDP